MFNVYSRSKRYSKPETFVCILPETVEIGEPAKSTVYRLRETPGQRTLAGSAYARKSGHISDRRKLRASLFTAFDGEGRFNKI